MEHLFKTSFPPLLSPSPQVLILGSLPGDESLRRQEYYANKQNRFWRLMALLTSEPMPVSYDDKKRIILSHHFALWDVAYSASRPGSSDSAICDEVANDIPSILFQHPSIRLIAFNGQKAHSLFVRHFPASFPGIRTLTLLSTSPANCQFTDAQMLENWKQLLHQTLF